MQSFVDEHTTAFCILFLSTLWTIVFMTNVIINRPGKGK